MATYHSILQNLDTSPIHLTTKQKHLLSLRTQLAETRLSIALLQAYQANGTTGTNDAASSAAADNHPTQADIKQAEKQVLNARAEYTLRERIITQTLIVDPILKAVHHDDYDDDNNNTAGPAADADASAVGIPTPLIREMKRAIHTRDVLAMLQGSISQRLSEAQQRIANAERENVVVNRQNAELAKRVVELAERLRAPRTEDIEDADVRKRLEEADEQVAQARRRWRIMKSLTSGIVVGSGVRWADDETLVELVLDDEDELTGF